MFLKQIPFHLIYIFPKYIFFGGLVGSGFMFLKLNPFVYIHHKGGILALSIFNNVSLDIIDVILLNMEIQYFTLCRSVLLHCGRFRPLVWTEDVFIRKLLDYLGIFPKINFLVEMGWQNFWFFLHAVKLMEVL